MCFLGIISKLSSLSPAWRTTGECSSMCSHHPCDLGPVRWLVLVGLGLEHRRHVDGAGGRESKCLDQEVEGGDVGAKEQVLGSELHSKSEL